MHRQVDFLVPARSVMLDIAGPTDVFVTANRFLERGAPPYRNRIIGVDRGPVTLTGGAQLVVDAPIGSQIAGDTLVIAGAAGEALEALCEERRILEFLRGAAMRYRRIVSICNGALLLARAGLLDGRRATTHWEDLDLLRRLAPRAQVCDDVLYVQDGPIFTSAGVSAGIDLALHLVELDHGRVVALRTARKLVVYLRRPGGQRQFSELLHAEFAAEPLEGFSEWLQQHLSRRVTLDAMAAAAGMSRRHFTRMFREATGTTPSAHVERLRVETAGNLLAGTALSLKQVARRCGFGSEQTLRRSFLRHFGIAPSEYRERFGAGAHA